MTPIEWLLGDDTGSSSKTILAVMTGAEPRNFEPSVPWDYADFGRCYRLLRDFPEWLPRLPEVAQKYPEWAPLVNQWSALSVLFEAGKYRAVSDVLYKLLRP